MPEVLTDQEIMNKLIEFLKSNVNNESGFQHVNLRDYFQIHSYEQNAKSMWDKILEKFHELFTNNIIMHFASLGSNIHPEIFTITTYGKEFLKNNDVIPYDPEGYVRNIQTRIPNLDAVTLIYLKESITAYNKNLLVSSTITLGAASENVVLNLIDNFLKFRNDINIANKINSKQFIYRKFQEFKKQFQMISKNLPKDLIVDFDVVIDTLFNFIRINRNITGHPTGTIVNKNIAYSNLQMFGLYLERVYKIMDYFNSNSYST